MRLISSTEANEVSGAMIGGGVDGNGVPLLSAGETPTWGAEWVIRYDSGSSWIDTGYSCMPLGATPDTPGFFESAFQEAWSWLNGMINRCELTEIGIPGGITFDCSPK
jgi:hypothetical protein